MLRNAVNRLVAVQARNVKLECASAQMYLLDQVSFKYYTWAESISLSLIQSVDWMIATPFIFREQPLNFSKSSSFASSQFYPFSISSSRLKVVK